MEFLNRVLTEFIDRILCSKMSVADLFIKNYSKFLVERFDYDLNVAVNNINYTNIY